MTEDDTFWEVETVDKLIEHGRQRLSLESKAHSQQLMIMLYYFGIKTLEKGETIRFVSAADDDEDILIGLPDDVIPTALLNQQFQSEMESVFGGDSADHLRAVLGDAPHPVKDFEPPMAK